MPSILKTGERRVLRYFLKYGFENVRLTMLVMDAKYTLDQVLSVEQYYIDNLPTSLNVDRVAQGSGCHTPMSEGMRLKLRIERGKQVFIYEASSMQFLHMFDSKQHLYTTLKIHHITLNNCMLNGSLYRNTYLFCPEPFTNLDHTQPISIPDLINLFKVVQVPR